jgi:hypothetical protein
MAPELDHAPPLKKEICCQSGMKCILKGNQRDAPVAVDRKTGTLPRFARLDQFFLQLVVL